MLILNSPRSQACILERNLSFTNPPKVTADSVCCPPIGWHSLNSTRNSEHLTCNKNFRSLTPCTLSDRSHGKEKGGLLNSFHTTKMSLWWQLVQWRAWVVLLQCSVYLSFMSRGLSSWIGPEWVNQRYCQNTTQVCYLWCQVTSSDKSNKWFARI